MALWLVADCSNDPNLVIRFDDQMDPQSVVLQFVGLASTNPGMEGPYMSWKVIDPDDLAAVFLLDAGDDTGYILPSDNDFTSQPISRNRDGGRVVVNTVAPNYDTALLEAQEAGLNPDELSWAAGNPNGPQTQPTQQPQNQIRLQETEDPSREQKRRNRGRRKSNASQEPHVQKQFKASGNRRVSAKKVPFVPSNVIPGAARTRGQLREKEEARVRAEEQARAQAAEANRQAINEDEDNLFREPREQVGGAMLEEPQTQPPAVTAVEDTQTQNNGREQIGRQLTSEVQQAITEIEPSQSNAEPQSVPHLFTGGPNSAFNRVSNGDNQPSNSALGLVKGSNQGYSGPPTALSYFELLLWRNPIVDENCKAELRQVDQRYEKGSPEWKEAVLFALAICEDAQRNARNELIMEPLSFPSINSDRIRSVLLTAALFRLWQAGAANLDSVLEAFDLQDLWTAEGFWSIYSLLCRTKIISQNSKKGSDAGSRPKWAFFLQEKEAVAAKEGREEVAQVHPRVVWEVGSGRAKEVLALL
ncbi:hypothetical protein ABW19_dt0200474 [Dactylella cylindrospora]|nr:hypothetical protein ABW19_dt0200474 [Dactylella cylindrospora]